MREIEVKYRFKLTEKEIRGIKYFANPKSKEDEFYPYDRESFDSLQESKLIGFISDEDCITLTDLGWKVFSQL